jgi:hypothetical protein
MRRSSRLAVLVVPVLLVACGGGGESTGGDAGSVSDAARDHARDARDRVLMFGDGAVGDRHACVNLECDIPPSCTTSVSGTVFDPGGHVPLYDVAVYIPNAPLQPIPTGVDIHQCEACSAPLSGSPLSVALTDSHGHFTLTNVPVTSAPVQLVIQSGRFRREDVILPPVKACMDNPIADPTHNIRLPKNQTEGHLPRIAVATGGCDSLETLLGPTGFGIDSAEFQAGPSTGSGRVVVYDSGATVYTLLSSTSPAYTMWNSDELFQYDFFVSDCECNPGYRGPNAYDNMRTYLDHGGRFFGSHWEYDFLGDTTAPASWQTAVQWYAKGSYDLDASAVPPWTPEGEGDWAPTSTCFIDTTFPKGKAFDEWTQFVYTSGYVTGVPTPPPGTNPVFGNTSALISGTVQPGVTRWIYGDSTNTTEPATSTGYNAHYLSIDMPYSATPGSATQCGRAFFGDTHIAGDPTQQSALEFVFFDLSSCVQDESQSPIAPPPK